MAAGGGTGSEGRVTEPDELPAVDDDCEGEAPRGAALPLLRVVG